jgi:hypothetical protein
MTESPVHYRRGMKSRSIRSVLRAKHSEWLESIMDEGVRDLVKHNSIYTGGCLASMLLGEPVNDYDVYFTNRETALAAAQYYVAQFEPKNRRGIACKISVLPEDDRIKIVIKSAGIASEDGAEKPYQYFEGATDEHAGEYVGEVMSDPGEIQDAHEETEELALINPDEDSRPKYRPVFMSTNAITLSQRVQVVLRFFGEPDEIHKNYDFVHCTNYWTSNDRLTLRPEAMEALLARELRYVGSRYPLCSIFRLRKFLRRGWVVNAGQLLKIAMQVSALDLRNHHVLEDQLTGVDAAYFLEVVQKLREKDPEKVDTAYLVEIIDRMFG